MKVSISEIQIVPTKPNNGLVGFASFVLNESMYIGSVGIYTRPHGGYRLAYPTRKTEYKSLNIVHPINQSTALEIEEKVIAKFEDVVNKYDRHNSYDID